MIRLSGLFKVAAVLMFDFLVVDTLFHNAQAAAAVTGVIALYIWLGEYLLCSERERSGLTNCPSMNGHVLSMQNRSL